MTRLAHPGRRSAAALLGIAAILAQAGHTAAAANAAALRWRVVVLPLPAAPYSYAEPGIAIGRDGIALVDAATANSGAPAALWSSGDAGATWSPAQSFDTAEPSTGDADTAIGADGYRYALDLGYNAAQPSNPAIQVFRSRDGRSWQGPAAFPLPHGADQPDRPWLAIDPRQPAHVDVVNSEGGGNIVLWRSQDHGATFSGPITVTGGGNTQAALALSSRPLFAPDGRLFMLYETDGTAATGPPPVYEFPLTQLWLAESLDGGSTWSNRLVLDSSALPGGGTLGHLLVASAIDRAGNLYAAISARPSAATQTQLYLLHSTDSGVHWTAPQGIATPTQSNVMPALAVSRSGVAYLSWYGSAASDYRDAGAVWFEMFARIADPLAARPAVTVGRISSTPVHAGGIDTAGAVGSDSGANWGLRDFQSIGVDGCGRPHAVWAVDDGTPSTQIAWPDMPCG